MLVALWKVFEKAGQPGWAAIIPFYNFYILLKVAGKPGWCLIFIFIPIANLVIAFIACLGVAENFGKSTGFAVGLFFLPFIFYPILAFGDVQYCGDTVAAGTVSQPGVN
jgi:hypothetical protein